MGLLLLLALAALGAAAVASSGKRSVPPPDPDEPKAPGAPPVLQRAPQTPTRPGLAPVQMRLAPLREAPVVPPGWSVFELTAPPWIASLPSLLGLRRGETSPETPYYHGSGPMSPSGNWGDLEHGLSDSASKGALPPAEIVKRLALGRQFVPARSGEGAKRWSTWHRGVLRAMASLLRSWAAERGASAALVQEATYAAKTCDAMVSALSAVNARINRGDAPNLPAGDPVLAEANARTAVVVDYLREHDDEIVAGMATLVATGTIAPGLGAALGGVLQGAAMLGPVGLVLTSVAILGVAVYAFITGARPDDTRGKGDDVLAFPRGGTADDPTWLRPVDLDAYMHGLYRAVLLDRQRRS